MPELPEVETIARGLAGLVGRRIRLVETGPHDWVRSPSPSPREHLLGRRIGAVKRHGKQLRILLEPGGELRIHLGMSGVVSREPADAEIAPHTHLRLGFEKSAEELRLRDPRRFGGAWIRSADGEWKDPRADPGPDALDLSVPEFTEILSRPRQLKALLLDQQAIAGIGNIYCDEALFAARLHPLALASGVRAPRVRELHGHIQEILHRAIRHGGSTLRDYRNAEGGSGDFQDRHLVYGRDGEPCVRCGGRVVRFLVAGRSTHICRRCQRAPRSRSAASTAVSRRGRKSSAGKRARVRSSP